MDDSSRRRRQNDPPIHAAPDPRYQSLHDPSQQQAQRRNYAGNPRDSYRPAPLNTSSTAAAAAAGAQRMGGSAGYSGYYPDSSGNFATTTMPQAGMSYHQPGADYGQTDARQAGGFATGTYNPMMYNVQQAASTQGAAVYDTSQSFAQRQPAGLQIMPTDVSTAAYFPGDTSQSTSALPGQAASSSTSQAVYQQPSMSSYSSSMANSALGGMAAQAATSADVSMEEEYPASGGLDEAYQSYQTALKEIFSNIRNGVLRSASDSLLNVSDWLLSHVSELGLTSDDQSLHSDRIKLWNDFNYAWLALLQRQKELMEAGQHSSNLIKQESLNKMGKDLVRLCDGIEPHGLVDYQYGVWEEQIVDILEQCLDLYEPADDSNGNAAASSSHAR